MYLDFHCFASKKREGLAAGFDRRACKTERGENQW